MSKCTICAHTDVAEISQALLSREPLRLVAERFGVSKSALSRHVRQHCTKDGLRRTAATATKPRRRKAEQIDAGVVLQEIAASLREMLSSHAQAMNPSAAAALSQALIRAIEAVEKREQREAERAAGVQQNPFGGMSPEALMQLRDALAAAKK